MAVDDGGSTLPMQEAKDFEQTPRGWARRWKAEIEASKKAVSRWHDSGDQIIKIFRNDDHRESTREGAPVRVPLFTSNVQTQRAIVYGEDPEAAVERRYFDANDEDARVAGEILERQLNHDLSHPLDTFHTVAGYCLDDFGLVGSGIMKWRYEAENEDLPGKPAITKNGKELAPAVEPGQRKKNEKVCADYVHWRDFLWSVSRTWLEVRWVAFRSYLNKDEFARQFGKDLISKVPFGTRKARNDDARDQDALRDDPWSRAEVWEIHSKEHRKIFFWMDGYPETLHPTKIPANPTKKKNKAYGVGWVPDQLGLDGFFPCPEPMLANLTTSSLVPRPDYALFQDLYNDMDELHHRCRMLAKAIKVRGAYDSKHPAFRRILSEANDQDMLPVDNWAQYSKDGGMKGAFEMLPVEMFAAALERLLDYRDRLKAVLDEVTGMGDIIRGASEFVGNGPVTATEQAIKARYASIRLRARQERFGCFISDALRIKAEIVCKHFSPESIIEQTNMGKTEDGLLLQKVQGALALLKSNFWFYRVNVKPGTVAAKDLAKVKSEREELLTGLSKFIPMIEPLVQTAPELVPVMLKLLRHGLVGFEADQEMQGIIDEGIQQFMQGQAQRAQQAAQAAANPPQDPRMQTEMIKAKAEQDKIALEASTEMQKITAESQADQAHIAAETRQKLLDSHLQNRDRISEARLNIARERFANQEERAEGVRPVKPANGAGEPFVG